MQNDDERRDVEGRPPRDIAARTFAFALCVITVVRSLPRDIAGQAIARQLIRSGTSIGANVEEAEAAHSKADFISKMNIARKEARESLYWLRLVAESGIVPADSVKELTAEADELVRILTAIVRNARSAQ